MIFLHIYELKHVLILGPNPSQLRIKLRTKSAAVNVPPLCLVHSQEGNILRLEHGRSTHLCLSCRHVTRQGPTLSCLQHQGRSTWPSLHVRASSLQCKPISNSPTKPSSPEHPSIWLFSVLQENVLLHSLLSGYVSYRHTVLWVGKSHRYLNKDVLLYTWNSLPAIWRHQGEQRSWGNRNDLSFPGN